MNYATFRERSQFAKEELLAFAHGTLVDDPPSGFAARLPIPPMIMLDRILTIERDGHRGRIVAERDVDADDWFYRCHFVDDPVQPGCLGLDGVWQMLGFFCVWSGGLGVGRALGVGEVEFSGQIRPHDRVVRTEMSVLRFKQLPSGASLAIADARLLVDGDPVYAVKRAKAGTFPGLRYDRQAAEGSRDRRLGS